MCVCVCVCVCFSLSLCVYRHRADMDISLVISAKHWTDGLKAGAFLPALTLPEEETYWFWPCDLFSWPLLWCHCFSSHIGSSSEQVLPCCSNTKSLLGTFILVSGLFLIDFPFKRCSSFFHFGKSADWLYFCESQTQSISLTCLCNK